MIMHETVATVLARAESDRDGALERLFALMRIPSVGTQPEHAPDCRRAAAWLARELSDLGFDATVRPTAGHPVVVAKHPGPAGAPHLLYYAHYDVQPADPREGWLTPPFEPALVDGPRGLRIVGRGAVDDKGQIMTLIEALRAWLASGEPLPARVTLLLEGEEEFGSPNLGAFLTAQREELAADVCVIVDMSMWDEHTPAITTRMRGMCYVEMTVRGPERELHSGRYGGCAVNPLNVLNQILGALHDDRGRVCIPGFYDRVRPAPDAERRSWASLGFDEARYLRSVGLTTPHGEKGFDGLERLWARPSADVNGIIGGYVGAGAKTAIPAQATAKLSFRLVPDQDPYEVFAAFERFVRDRLPPDVQLSLTPFTMAPAFSVPVDTPWMEAARAALAAEMGRDTVLVGAGGTIPAVTMLQRSLGMDCLLVGFGLNDDRNHGPNEKFELACFRHGIRGHIRLLNALAGCGAMGGVNAHPSG
ncbi:M20/M25/M40 family metallo-hydrolase [Elioraea sp.]|uniref:M20/M25/M40 family metallo-hydrolase n=1 Tax=Elioraea sp. TaxID=2185103 RepID=UPI003F71CA71